MQLTVLPPVNLPHNLMLKTKVMALKLVKKILALKYNNMAELQSDHWDNRVNLLWWPLYQEHPTDPSLQHPYLARLLCLLGYQSCVQHT